MDRSFKIGFLSATALFGGLVLLKTICRASCKSKKCGQCPFQKSATCEEKQKTCQQAQSQQQALAQQQVQTQQQQQQFETKSIHAGFDPYKDQFGCMVPHISLSTTYAQLEPSKPVGAFDYIRCGNPTRSFLEALINELYECEYSMIYGSGNAARNSVLQSLGKDDQVLVSENEKQSQVFQTLQKIQGFEIIVTDFNNIEQVKSTFQQSKIKMVWISQPCDLQKITPLFKDALIIVDNSAFTSYNLNPLKLGANIVLEDCFQNYGVNLGFIAFSGKDLNEKMYLINKSIGDTMGPLNLYLVHRAFKTVGLRMQVAANNAQQVANFLKTHAQKLSLSEVQLNSFKTSKTAGNQIQVKLEQQKDLSKFKIIKRQKTFCVTNVEISKNTLTINVGLEDVEYIIADIFQALK